MRRGCSEQLAHGQGAPQRQPGPQHRAEEQGEQTPGGSVALAVKIAAAHDPGRVEREAGFPQGGPLAGQAVLARQGLFGPGQVGDGAVPAFDQVPGGESHPGGTVHVHPWEVPVRRGAAEGHEGQAAV
jgi:hypothetical protein